MPEYEMLMLKCGSIFFVDFNIWKTDIAQTYVRVHKNEEKKGFANCKQTHCDCCQTG